MRRPSAQFVKLFMSVFVLPALLYCVIVIPFVLIAGDRIALAWCVAFVFVRTIWDTFREIRQDFNAWRRYRGI